MSLLLLFGGTADQTATATEANAQAAAPAPTVAVIVSPAPAAGNGSAFDAATSAAAQTTVQPVAANAAGGAPDPSASQSSTATAGIAQGTGLAPDAVVPVAVNALPATGTAEAETPLALTGTVAVVAGRARPVVVGQSVGLDVTATPANGQTITSYSWSITSGAGTLTNATTATPTYTAPSSGSGLATIRATVNSTGSGTGSATCTVSYHANIVAAENALTGTARTAWDLPTTALGGVATLQGFADGFSYNRDQTVNFKIAQSDTAGWTANVYRLGYYGGNGARDYGPANPTGGQVTTSQAQPAPGDADPNTTKLSADCSNWSVTLTWTPPAWAPSGIYVLKLNRTGGGASHVMFVLRDDARAADLMFMPADSTWHAYNAFGGMGTANWLNGNSLYFGTAVDQYNADCARFVSYNRPFVNRQAATSGVSYGAVEYSTFFTSEYGMLRFVERNGIDTKYYGCIDAAGDSSGTHLSGNGSTRGGVKTGIFVGHNEYWSNNMRAGWEAAKAAGVNIFSCAGNEVFWRLVGSNNDSAGRPRTWECFKSTIAARGSTGRTEWTGTWRDPDGAGKGGNSPENTFTGTIFVTNGPDLRSLVVPVSGGYSAQPLWRHTSVAALSTGSYTSPAQIVGFEWDTYGPAGTDNAAAAACLAAPNARARYCSTATYNTTVQLQDAGDVYGTGNNTHRLVVHPNGGGHGGITFGTGTVNWAWGVDSANTYQLGSDNTDVVLQQATINMLVDMGAAPATLMGTLVSPTPAAWYVDPPTTRATAAANSPTPRVTVAPATAAGTGAASATGTGAVVTAGGAQAASDAPDPAAGASQTVAIATAQATGTALAPAVSISISSSVTALVAAGTGKVDDATVTVSQLVTPATATATGAALTATTSTAVLAGASVATATGDAPDPQTAIRATAATASATGVAPNAIGTSSTDAVAAAATANAAGLVEFDPTTSTSLTLVADSAVGATGQAFNPIAVKGIVAAASTAAGAVTATSPSLSVVVVSSSAATVAGRANTATAATSSAGSVTALTANAPGQAFGPVVATSAVVHPGAASATGSGEPATGSGSVTALAARVDAAALNAQTTATGSGSVTAFSVTAMALGVAFDADCGQGGGFIEVYAGDPRIVQPLVHAGVPALL